MTVRLMMLDPDLPVPARAHAWDAGLDLPARESVVLRPGERYLMPTGVAVALTDGYVGLVCPRSGLAQQQGLGLVNGPGVIDAGYRGELRAVLVNHDPLTDIRIQRGDRIAQLVVLPVSVEPFELVADLENLGSSERGHGGFGSTGR